MPSVAGVLRRAPNRSGCWSTAPLYNARGDQAAKPERTDRTRVFVGHQTAAAGQFTPTTARPAGRLYVIARNPKTGRKPDVRGFRPPPGGMGLIRKHFGLQCSRARAPTAPQRRILGGAGRKKKATASRTR